MEITVYRDWHGHKQKVGTLRRQEGLGSEQLFYDDAFLKSGSLGISQRIPLSDGIFESSEIAPFFQGLLPEGEVIAHVSRMGQVPRNDWFGLIAMLGCESIGALTFATDDLQPGCPEGSYEPLKPEDVLALREHPAHVAAAVASSTRLSLAGAQSKVAWTLPKGVSPCDARIEDWLVPRGGAASTHIVKISRNGEEDLAINELACSYLAKSCGIETASVYEIPQVPGAIAVERYDRLWHEADGRQAVERLHQEDFCQALGLAPFYKYQPQGVEADYVEMAGDLLGETVAVPAEARVEFAKRLVFNYAVGNSDAHLKNSSLLYGKDWRSRTLAPLYDVTCIPLSGYSTKMPFVVGEHREMEEIDEGDIFQICVSADASIGAFDKAVAEVESGLTAPVIPDCGQNVLAMIDQILENSKPRIKVLQNYLDNAG